MMKAGINNVISIDEAKNLKQLKCHTDDELMQLASANVKEAFAEIVRRHQGQVRGFCRKWNGQGGDDLAQDVFVRLWRARHRYRPQNEFKAYLFRIVVNRCRNATRSLRRRPPMEELKPEKVTEASSGNQLEKILEREQLLRVYRQIRKLSPKLKEALLLRFGQEMSYRQIAQITDSKEATVRSRVLLGVERIKKEL